MQVAPIHQLIKSGSSLFRKMQSPVHCLNLLFSPEKITDYELKNSHSSVILMFLNNSLLIGPSLVCNCCVRFFLLFLLFGVQVSWYR